MSRDISTRSGCSCLFLHPKFSLFLTLYFPGLPSPILSFFMISLFLPVFWLMASYVGNRFKWKVALETSTVPSKQHCCDSGGVPSSAQPELPSRCAISWWFQWFSAVTTVGGFQLLTSSNQLTVMYWNRHWNSLTQLPSATSFETHFWVILSLTPYFSPTPVSSTQKEKGKKILICLCFVSACKVSLGLYTKFYRIPQNILGTPSEF